MSLTLFVAPNGNDFNAGTFEQPFATVQAALSTLPVGQGGTVFLRGGSYQLTSPIRVSDDEGGTASSPLSIRNYQNEKVLLDGRKLGPQGLDSIILTSTEFVEIQGLEIQGSNVGISVLGDARDITIRDNIVHDIQRAGIAAYAANQRSIRNITIDGNTVYRTNLFNQDRPAVQPGGWGSGIVFSRTEGGRISNNVVYQNYGEGIAITLSNGALAENNTVFDNYSVQVYLDHATNSIVDRNWIFNTGDEAFYRRFIQPDGSTVERAGKGILFANETYADANPLSNNLIRNNIVVGGDVAIGYGNFDQGGGLKKTLIANNTFYANRTTRNILEIAPDKHADNNIVNNIFYAEAPSQIVFLPDSLNGLNFSSNLWFGTDPRTAASPTDISTDPLFANPGGFDAQDYAIAAASSAINRGRNLTQVSTDFLGNPRPINGVYDLGAYEFGQILAGSGLEPVVFEAIPLETPIFGKTYQLTNASVSWANAVAEAAASGGQLVTINDAAEQTWLRETFGPTERFWIGLTDREVEGEFRWNNGEISDYRNFAPGEPNNALGNGPGGEDIFVMNWDGTTGGWNDLAENSNAVYRGIIEIG